MIPQTNTLLNQDFTIASLPTNTFQMHLDTDTIYGFTDEKPAMEQAIYLILSTERYQWLIHSWNYGVELLDLFGQPVSFVLPELKRRIAEALLQDDRITGVDNFQFETQGGRVHTTFTAHTIFGEIEAERTVEIA